MVPLLSIHRWIGAGADWPLLLGWAAGANPRLAGHSANFRRQRPLPKIDLTGIMCAKGPDGPKGERGPGGHQPAFGSIPL